MQAAVRMKNGKNLKVKALMDSRCTHTGINKQLVKDKRIQTKKINFSFEVFNAEGTKNREVTKVAPLEVKINGCKETLEVAVLWQPLDTKSNDHTTSKSLKADI